MKFRKIGIIALCWALLATSGTAAFAGTSMAFRNGIAAFVPNNGCVWKRVGFVTITVAEPGSVVVTASGMATFNSNSVLELTLATQAGVLGPWQFWLTAAPPMPSFQTYSVTRVFNVAAGTHTFFLNGRGCNNPSGQMRVETSSMIAEFYPTADAQPFGTTAAQPPALNSRPVE